MKCHFFTSMTESVLVSSGKTWSKVVNDAWGKVKLQEYSETSGLLKHPILWHPLIDSHVNSLCLNFQFAITLVRYAGEHELYFSIEYCTVISDARASDIQKCEALPSALFVKTVLILQKTYWSEIYINRAQIKSPHFFNIPQINVDTFACFSKANMLAPLVLPFDVVEIWPVLTLTLELWVIWKSCHWLFLIFY